MAPTDGQTNGHSLAPFTSSNLYFRPLLPSHSPLPGKENHGRYMLAVPWSRVSGWGQARIEPLRPIEMDPLSGTLQYAVTCFEGMKCYGGVDGKNRLFRPERNFARFKRSAKRLGLPYDWDDDALLDLMGKLLSLESTLVPAEPGSSLYIRPTLIETSESFGIKADAYAAEALLFVVTTQNLGLGLYASAEAPEKGLRLDACTEYIRAWPGGTGSYKLGANYGWFPTSPGIKLNLVGTVSVAKKPGFHMSLWLHGKDDFISEAGAMNVFMLKEATDGTLEFITMPLENGIVLPGITRESIIEMINDHASGKKAFPVAGLPRNIRVVERDFSMPEVVESLREGSCKGIFGCGTGVVVVAIKDIQYQGQVHRIPYSPIPLLLRDAVSGIQRGEIEHDWSYEIPQWQAGQDGEADVEGQKVVA